MYDQNWFCFVLLWFLFNSRHALPVPQKMIYIHVQRDYNGIFIRNLSFIFECQVRTSETIWPQVTQNDTQTMTKWLVLAKWVSVNLCPFWAIVSNSFLTQMHVQKTIALFPHIDIQFSWEILIIYSNIRLEFRLNIVKLSHVSRSVSGFLKNWRTDFGWFSFSFFSAQTGIIIVAKFSIWFSSVYIKFN